MARFGNSSASGLLSAAASGKTKLDAINDSEAAQQYNLSAKTTDNLAAYSDYLKKRISTIQNVDPSKAISLQNNLISATRSFNSAEIGRYTTSVKFGQMSNTDKYNAIAGLYEQAQQSGDDNLAQSLYSQLGSLSVTIQNEQQANYDHATAAADKALTANNGDVKNTIGKVDEFLTLAKGQLAQGKISETQYQDQVNQALHQKAALYDGALKGQFGDLNPQDMENLRQDAAKFSASPDYLHSVGREHGLSAANVDKALKYDNGTQSYSEADRPVSYVDQQGNNIYKLGVDGNTFNRIALTKGGTEDSPQTAEGFTIPAGQRNAGDTAIFDPRTGKYLYKHDNGKGQPATYSIYGSQDLKEGADLAPAQKGLSNSKLEQNSIYQTAKATLANGLNFGRKAGASLLPSLIPGGGTLGAILSAPGIGSAVNNFLHPAPPASQVAAAPVRPITIAPTGNRYAAPSPYQTPAQTFSRALPASGTPTTTQIGNAIGSAVGYAPRMYLEPFKSQLAFPHYNIIASGTNYGGTVQALRNAGVTDSMLATGGVYDQALRAANSNGQFK